MKKIILLILFGFCASLALFTVTSASESGLVIDEFRTRSLAVSTDEYIVLANYGRTDLDLEGYVLKKITASGRNYELITFGSYTLRAGQKIILGYTNFTGAKGLTYTKSSIADKDTAIVLYDSKSNIIDSVTYGTVNFGMQEGTALANPEAAIPYKRINGRDTNNNASDFAAVKAVSLAYDGNANKIRLNEMLPNPKSGNEWFELYNPTNVSVKLSGLSVCDLKGSTHCFDLPTEMISPHGYKVYDSAKSKITLNDDSDGLILKSGGTKIDATSLFSKAKNGISFSRFGTSWKWTASITKGSVNIDRAVASTTSGKKTPIKKSSHDSVSNDNSGEFIADEVSNEEVPTVKAAEVARSEKTKITQGQIGYILIVVAAALVFGYTIYENREKMHDLYDKILRRNN